MSNHRIHSGRPFSRTPSKGVGPPSSADARVSSGQPPLSRHARLQDAQRWRRMASRTPQLSQNVVTVNTGNPGTAFQANIWLLQIGLWWLYGDAQAPNFAITESNFGTAVWTIAHIAFATARQDDKPNFSRTIRNEYPLCEGAYMVEVLEDAVGGPKDLGTTLRYQYHTNGKAYISHADHLRSYECHYFDTLQRLHEIMGYLTASATMHRKNKNMIIAAMDLLIQAKIDLELEWRRDHNDE